MTRLRFLFLTLSLVIAMPDELDAQNYARSPEVHADRKVTFRYFAPNAGSVKLQGNVPEISGEMMKVAQGFWSKTVGPLAPDTYPYRFNVDNAVVIDPVNRNLKAWLWMENMVEVPANIAAGEKPPMHHIQNVPHGAVTSHWYQSTAMQKTRRLFVYTPPGYQTGNQKYPVLYLLHGFGDDESAWSSVGKAQHIADNMLAAKRSTQAIIVMPFGHEELPKSPDFQTYPLMKNLAAIEKELLEGVIPFVETNYRCKTETADRAIAGLSMGGGQSLHIGIRNLDKFRWIAGFSSSIKKQKIEETAQANLNGLQANQHWLWLGCGKDDFLLDDSVDFDKWLTENKVEHKTRLTKGAHNWRCWRGYLEEVLSEVFVN